MLQVTTQEPKGGSGDSPLRVLLDFMEDPLVLEITILSLLAILVLWLFLSLRSSLRSL